jgi:hypothetical protein
MTTQSKLTDGRARIENCPRCDEPTIRAYCDGIYTRLSRFSLPLSHAGILGKYGRLTFNVYKGLTGLHVSYWSPMEGRPDRGRLYSQHFCISRR